jgi:MYXO-CTERM domain-containing protein
MIRIVTLLALLAAMPLGAATLTVTNLNDTGAGSLRQACTDAVSGDTVVFQAGLAGAITFTAGQIDLGAKALTITGNADVSGAPAITLDGNGATRLLNTGAALSLDTLALYQGYALGSGGAIYSTSTVTCTDCTFSSNTAGSGGAIFCGGSGLTCTGCTFSSNYGGNGGAITSAGTVTCSACTFEYNFVGTPSSTGNGGAIAAVGDVTCTDCTFSANSIDSGGGNGGAIHQFGVGYSVNCTNCTFDGNNTPYGGSGGAIYCVCNGIACTGCTFFANYALGAGGAICALVYGVTCTDCTFSNNIGIVRCLYTGAQVTITNCIVAEPLSGTMFGNIGGAAIFTSGGYNICTASAVDVPWMNATGDQMSTDAMLGPLQDNGGPVPTMRPLIGSPAIDKGGASTTTVDARGYARPADDPAIANAAGGDGRDIGAVEWELPEITLLRDGVEITDGGGDNAYGAAGIAISRVFTIRNDGYATLNIGAITFSNQSNCTVTVSAAPAATLAHAATTTFTLEITPTAASPFSFDMQIASDDTGENPYDVHIVGTALAAGGGNDDNDSDEGCTTGATPGYPVALAAALLLLAARRRRHSARA